MTRAWAATVPAATSGPAADVVAEIEQAGGKAVAHTGRLPRGTTSPTWCTPPSSTFGTLTGVVNNAGIVRDSMVAARPKPIGMR